MILAPSLEELIPEGTLVKVVSKMIVGSKKGFWKVNIKGGASAYDPQMLLIESDYLCLYPAGILIAEDSQRIARECKFHVDKRHEPVGSPNDQSL